MEWLGGSLRAVRRPDGPEDLTSGPEQDDPAVVSPEAPPPDPGDLAERAQLIADYAERFANPYVAAARGYVDDVIDPRDTHAKMIHAFEMLKTKTDSTPAKKHSNLPL